MWPFKKKQPKNEPAQAPEVKPKPKVSMTFEISVNITDNELKARELSKLATQKRDELEFDEAVLLLKQVRELRKESRATHSILELLRLPLFLESADRFDEALIEFNLLLDDSYERAKRNASHLTDAKWKNMAAQDRKVIKDKIALARKRTEKKAKAAEV